MLIREAQLFGGKIIGGEATKVSMPAIRWQVPWIITGHIDALNAPLLAQCLNVENTLGVGLLTNSSKFFLIKDIGPSAPRPATCSSDFAGASQRFCL